MTPRETARNDETHNSIDFSMAFQPIVDIVAGRIYAYEALVRGRSGEPAAEVLSQVSEEHLYAFDQSCRVKAISLACNLGLVEQGAALAVNFLPGAIYDPATCIRGTLDIARSLDFPTDRLIFEVSEQEHVEQPGHLQAIADRYKRQGFRMALDDFGAGYANLALLSELSVEVLKLDMRLVRNLHLRPKAQAIISSLITLGKLLRMDVIAEGVEKEEEYAALRTCGVRLMQGYLLAHPGFESLPSFTLPEIGPLRISAMHSAMGYGRYRIAS